MAEDGSEKTEAPTQRRKEEQRLEGNVARSSDLSAAASILAAMCVLYVAGNYMMGAMKMILQRMLEPASAAYNPTLVGSIGSDMAYMAQTVLRALGPVVVCIVFVAFAATLAQVGWVLSLKPLQPSFGKMSPLKGLKNMVNMRAGVRLSMSLAKLVLIFVVAGVLVYQDIGQLAVLASLEVRPLYVSIGSMVFMLGIKLGLLLLVLAIIDYSYQRWQTEKDMRMTKQDLKEELKRMEGDPQIKQRRSRVAKQLALQRIGQAVPQSDVVVTNPTHFAIALKYDSDTMKAPKVVAKGADFMAMRMRQLAAAHSVPLVERKELARAMYKHVEVGQEVPEQFYSAIAEILAYVYRLGGKKVA